MTASDKVYVLKQTLAARDIDLPSIAVAALRRAEKTLHGWAEAECGRSNAYSSWAIERDEETGIAYRVVYPHKGEVRRTKIADRESGALRRVTDICQKHSLYYYHQTDPRGCALYVSREPLTDINYSNHGVACSV
jgi:hypothetical protein